jgi:hypothetical protein
LRLRAWNPYATSSGFNVAGEWTGGLAYRF